jgi:hypothetical protein
MQVKLLELRDEGMFIPLLAIDMNPNIHLYRGINEEQRYLLRRCGYPCDLTPNIAITRLSCDGQPCSNDPYQWGGRTFPVAHRYIIEHWNDLKDGDVVDVEYILGETKKIKISERLVG